jgi:copper resistance protein B
VKHAGTRRRSACGVLLVFASLLALPALAEQPGHLHGDFLNGHLRVDELEGQATDTHGTLRWDGEAWLGTDLDRVLLRAEGSRRGGATEESELELFWRRPVAPWWNLLLGLRNDSGAGPARTYAALGVEGTAPGRIPLEFTAYLGEGGQSGFDVATHYDVLLTQRLVLTPRAEAAIWFRNDADTGIGRGLSTTRAGLRLRYELRRELAPYLGAEWHRAYGDTGKAVAADGQRRSEMYLLAGLRFWF